MTEPSEQISCIEPQYNVILELQRKQGFSHLGLMSNFVWEDDPRHFAFTSSRYKFVSKMLSGRKRVLEVGCGDAFFSRLVRQEVDSLKAVDIDPILIEDAKQRTNERWNYDLEVHDMLAGPVDGIFDAAYSLDVLEHIQPTQERTFLKNIAASLTPHGVLVIGCPSLESQAHASPQSKAGHVNCKSGEDLKRLLGVFFENVFLFSMNDEVVHTGFSPMAHYLLALACTKKVEDF